MEVLSHAMPTLCEHVAADVGISAARVRELAEIAIAGGRPEDPLLGVSLEAHVHRALPADDPRGDVEWVTSVTTFLRQRETSETLAASLRLDDRGVPLDDAAPRVDLIVPASRARALERFAAGDLVGFFGLPAM